MHTHLHAHTHISKHTNISIHMIGACTHTHTHTHTHTCNTHIFMHICTCTHTSLFTHTPWIMHTSPPPPPHTHTHTDMHTHTVSWWKGYMVTSRWEVVVSCERKQLPALLKCMQQVSPALSTAGRTYTTNSIPLKTGASAVTLML